MPGSRLVVFDWDGTLMDSVGTIVACTLAVQRELGLGEMDAGRVRRTIGLGLADVFERLVPGAGPERREQVVACYRRHWLETYRHRLDLFDGVADVLAALEARGYVLAIATGKSREGLDRDLAECGLAGRFAATRTVSEARSKPHPQMLLDLLGELRFEPGDALMVGDTTFDLEMAHAAGVDAVAVLSGGHGRPELQAARPRAVLASVRELPAWLAARAPSAS